jgi:hypothetical protein
MAEKRRGYAPYSLTREAGVQSATVNGDIDVIQEIRPTINAGFLDETGDWKGTKSSDEVFIAFDKHVGIPNGGEMLTPQAVNDRTWPIDMTGFRDIFIAIKPSVGGNYAISAVMGPDTNSFANLNPIAPARLLRFSNNGRVGDDGMDKVLDDANEDCQTGLWNIFMIMGRASNQKLLQFKVVNNSGSESDVEFAFMRLV